MVELKTDKLKLIVDPFGAEMKHLSLIGSENVLWEKDVQYWNRVAPNLFPIVGKLKNDEYKYNNQVYSLSQHGFARDLVFTCFKQTENSIHFVLENSEFTLNRFPFEFRFEVNYFIEDEQLTIEYKTTNNGTETMYYSVGAHPAFKLTRSIDDYTLNFPEEFSAERQLLNSGLFANQSFFKTKECTIPLTENLFEQDALVFIDTPFKEVSLQETGIKNVVTIKADTMSAIGFWKKPNAPFLCIEPWWGYSDFENTNGEISDKKGIRNLAPGNTENLSYQICF